MNSFFSKCRRSLTSGRARWWPLLGVLLLEGSAGAQSPDRQAVIALRSLAYDNNLAKRAGDELLVTVLYRPDVPASAERSLRLVEALTKLGTMKVQGLPLRAQRMAWTGLPALRSSVEAQGVDVLFLCDGLEAELGALTAYSRQEKLLTVSGVPGAVEKGVSLGVFLTGDRYTIGVNLPASSAEGASFSSDLLRLATTLIR
ncbi:YfiR family protein [Myxococcus sp. K38C18041901]|uniref:YfiR family protein n=1 Tax=Myxococcus guangdongensis TaxID=2906760 RepID=UPI0020A812BF|nr:YfiR family protein [Myxococcus guangdongensis]MCP3061203.1 YfiR family protein [Myxococcus guangdongensis]